MTDSAENKQEAKDHNLCLFYSTPESLSDIFTKYKFLKSLTVIGQKVETLQGIETLNNLEDLWLVEGGLQQETVGPLADCVTLKRLYLYDNELSAIPDLGKLLNLTHLWLSGNCIYSFENINSLSSVKELYLSNNCLERIDVMLKKTLKIRCLNLSGNPVSSIKEVQKLEALRHLRWLLLSDPLYRRSPITLTANWRAYVIHSLPALEGLDCTLISSLERSQTTKLYKTNLQYYRLTLHKSLAELSSLQKLALESKCKELGTIWSALHCHGPLRKKTDSEEMDNLRFWECEAERWKQKRELCLKHYKKLEEIIVKKTQLEYEYVGNLTFEEVRFIKDSGLDKIKEKFGSFICSHLKQKIVDIDIMKVWTVKGPHTLTVAQDKFKDSLDDVYILCPVDEVSIKPLELIEHFLFDKLQPEEGVWLGECFAASDPLVADSLMVHRQLLLRSQTLLSWRLVVLCGATAVTIDQGCSSRLQNSLNCRRFCLPSTSSVVPLYVVAFQYIFEDYFKPLRDSTPALDNTQSVPMFPRLSPLKNITRLVLPSAKLHNLDKMSPMIHVSSADLSHNYITDLSDIGTIFPKVASLNLSFNKIASLDSVQNVKSLCHLDLSWNWLSSFLDSVVQLEKLSSLRHLDLRWNPWTDVLSTDHQAVLALHHLRGLMSLDGVSTQRAPAAEEITVDQWPQVTFSTRGHELGPAEESNCLGVIGNQVVSIIVRHQQMTQLQSAFPLSRLKWLDLSRNLVSSSLPMRGLSMLEHVNLSSNVIESLLGPGERYRQLVELRLAHNYMSTLAGFSGQAFPNLKVLDVSHNVLQALPALAGLKCLEELYLSHNSLLDCDSLAPCKGCCSLAVIDISHNPLSSNINLRETCLYYMPTLKYINGSKVQQSELRNAVQLYEGLLDEDYLCRVYPSAMLANLTHLSLPNCSIKKVVLPQFTLPNVETLNLDHNSLSSLSWLEAFPRLARLTLSHNRVTCYCHPSLSSPHSPTHVLHTLILDHNRVSNLVPLRLDLFPSLAVLVLNDNNIFSLSGLNKNFNLECLILDRNKLSSITIEQMEKLENLVELFLERNSLTKLDFVKPLKKLKKLFVGFNKLIAKTSLEALSDLLSLEELTVHGNPVTKRPRAYQDCLPHLPSLRLLEGHLLSDYKK